MTAQTTRRAMLGALAAVPAVVALPPALAAIPDAPDRGEWDRLFAAYERAKAADAADNARHEPIGRAYFAAEEALPHVEVPRYSYSDDASNVSTADRIEVAQARRHRQEVAEGRAYFETDRYPDLRDQLEYWRRLAAAADERDAELQRIADRLGYHASADRNDALGQAAYEAEIALIETPAPDAEALLWKLERLFGKHDRGDGYGASYSGDWLDILLADARRLAERGALA